MYASCFSNQALKSYLFFLGTAAASFSKVEKADGLTGSYYNLLVDISIFFLARRNADSTSLLLDFAETGAMISGKISIR